MQQLARKVLELNRFYKHPKLNQFLVGNKMFFFTLIRFLLVWNKIIDPCKLRALLEQVVGPLPREIHGGGESSPPPYELGEYFTESFENILKGVRIFFNGRGSKFIFTTKTRSPWPGASISHTILYLFLRTPRGSRIPAHLLKCPIRVKLLYTSHPADRSLHILACMRIDTIQ